VHARRHFTGKALFVPFPAVETARTHQFLEVAHAAFLAYQIFMILVDFHEPLESAVAGIAFKFVNGHAPSVPSMPLSAS
jgi:hypothetical protein